MLKNIHFGQTENARETRRMLVNIIQDIQQTAQKIDQTSWRMPDDELRGVLGAYADIINGLASNLCDQFEFYQ